MIVCDVWGGMMSGEEDFCLDDLSPEEYQEYSELDNKLMQLQLSGHLGQSVRFL